MQSLLDSYNGERQGPGQHTSSDHRLRGLDSHVGWSCVQCIAAPWLFRCRSHPRGSPDQGHVPLLG